MEDVVWKKFWRLTVLSYWRKEQKSWWSRKTAFCICNCWNKKEVSIYSLIRKTRPTQSCWCIREEKNKKHWMRHTRFYRIFMWAYARCNNKNVENYKNYWWRWIKLCREKFEDFMLDMYDSYVEHVNMYWEVQTSLDRIDVNGNYCKWNCKWSTRKEQANNTTKNVFATYKWETHTLQQRLDLLWIKRSSI